MIESTGFFRAKAASLQGMAARLVEAYGGEVPGRLKDLVTLPGVGRKTANVVLGNAFGVPGITVDTHFGRLSRRFGWTTAEDPEKVEAEVGSLVPEVGLDGAVAPDDLARPPRLPLPHPRVRRLPAGPAVPQLRGGSDRPGEGRQAGQGRTMSSRDGSGMSSGSAGEDRLATAPEWFAAFLGAIDGVAGHELSRFTPPPDSETRSSAVLILFGEGPHGPDVLLIERAADMRSHAGPAGVPRWGRRSRG